MFKYITDFQKHFTVSIWMLNVLLNKSCGMMPQYKLRYYKYNKLDILKWVNYGQLWILI